jgi:hypothetical protein
MGGSLSSDTQKNQWLQLVNTNKPYKKCCVISGDNRTTKEILLLKNINKAYCKKNNYSFKFYKNTTDLYPPYWWKVYIVYKIMLENNYKYIMWIDSDACFHNHNIKIENLFDDQVIFIMAPDCYNVPSPFNAGIWIVKNNKKGKKLISDWLNMYDKTKWYIKDNKWICMDSTWAGYYYEQGAFCKLMKNNSYKKNILKLPWEALQQHNVKPDNYAWTLHFAGNPSKQKIIYYCKLNYQSI